MRGSFFKGIVLGALVAALVSVAAAAIAGTTGIGDPFLLGKPNSVDNATSGLSGSNAGPMLDVRNTGAGTALNLGVASGVPPLTVGSSTKVVNLNADKVDGKHASAFLPVAGKAADSDLLDGIDSTGFYAAGSKVADSAHADNADHATSADTATNAGHATSADSATNAGNANLLDGLDSTAFVRGNGSIASAGMTMALGQNQTVRMPASGMYTVQFKCPTVPYQDDTMILTMTTFGGDNIDVWVDAGGGNPLYYLGISNGTAISLAPYGAAADAYTIQVRSNNGKLSTAEITTANFQTFCRVEIQETVTG